VPCPFNMVVSSFVIVIFLAKPRVAWILSGVYPFLSREIPAYSATYWPPVTTAISCIVAFLLSPNDGALTTHTLRLPFNLFTIRLAKISLSTSSAIMTNGFCCL